MGKYLVVPFINTFSYLGFLIVIFNVITNEWGLDNNYRLLVGLVALYAMILKFRVASLEDRINELKEKR